MSSPQSRVSRSPLVAIFLTVAVDLIGFGIIIPLMPLYAESFGARPWQIGFLFASYSLMNFICAPLWGRLSDRIGRRPVLLASIGLNALALLVFALAPSFTWLLVARLWAGISTANVSVASAYIADTTTLQNRAKGMGLVGAAFGLGFVLGPAIAAEVSPWGMAAPAFVAFGLACANFVSAFFFLPESLPKELRKPGPALSFRKRFTALSDVPDLPRLFGLMFVYVAAFSLMETSFVLFAERRLGFGVQQTGRVFTYIGVLMVIVQGGLIGRLARRFGERRLLLLGLLAVSVGLLGVPLVHGVPPLLVAVAFVAVGSGLVNPSVQALVSKTSPTDRQGLALGFLQSMGALARVVGPQAGGILFDFGSPELPFYVAAAVTVLATGVAFLYVVEPRAKT